MQHKIISGDNHIDLTYCPTDLWSSQAPQKWKKLAPRVEERNDGQHWFVDDKDRGMWNGVGPGFLPYTKGMFDHIDEMKELGFEWNSYPGAQAAADHPGIAPRRSRPRRARQGNHLRLPDGQRSDRRRRAAHLGQRTLQRLGRRFRQALRPEPGVSAGDHPQHRPEGRRRRGAALRQDGAEGRRSRLQAHDPAALPPGLVRAVGSVGRVQIPDLVPLDRVQGGARARHAGDGEGGLHPVAAGALDAVPARHDGGAGLDARLGRLREIPRFQLRARRDRA